MDISLDQLRVELVQALGIAAWDNAVLKAQVKAQAEEIESLRFNMPTEGEE